MGVAAAGSRASSAPELRERLEVTLGGEALNDLAWHIRLLVDRQSSVIIACPPQQVTQLLAWLQFVLQHHRTIDGTSDKNHYVLSSFLEGWL